MVPQGKCVYITQSTSACVITNMLHFWLYKNLPKPDATCHLSLSDVAFTAIHTVFSCSQFSLAPILLSDSRMLFKKLTCAVI